MTSCKIGNIRPAANHQGYFVMSHSKWMISFAIALGLAVAIGIIVYPRWSTAGAAPSRVVVVWERTVPEDLQGRLYEVAIVTGAPEVVAASVGGVVRVDETSQFEYLLELATERRATLAQDGRHFGIMTYSVHEIEDFQVLEIARDRTLVPLGNVETPLNFHYRLAPQGDSFVGIDLGGQHIPSDADRYIYKIFHSSGEIIGEVSSPNPQPNDSAYSPDGVTFLVNNRDGLSSYNLEDASLRWKIPRLTRFFASANSLVDIVAISDDRQRTVVEIYRAGEFLSRFVLERNVRNLAVSPNGELVAASDARTLVVLSPGTQRPLWSFTVPDRQLSINSVAVNDGGIVVFGAQHDNLKKGTAFIFDRTGTQIFRRDLDHRRSNAWIPVVQFDSTGRFSLIRTLELFILVSVE